MGERESAVKKSESYLLGILRWRGEWNWKDITERIVAGFISGLGAGISFYVMIRLLGGA